MPAPTVGATPNKSNLNQGENVTVTFTASDVPNDVATPRKIEYSGHDEEGNVVTGELTIISHAADPESFVLDYVRWKDTGVQFQINGMQATGTA